MTICDEAGGAPLNDVIHQIRAGGQRTGLRTRRVQVDLRQVFTRWGLADAIRTDRDPLFIGSGPLQWPGTLQLWLVGLGFAPIINRAYRPTDSANEHNLLVQSQEGHPQQTQQGDGTPLSYVQQTAAQATSRPSDDRYLS